MDEGSAAHLLAEMGGVAMTSGAGLSQVGATAFKGGWGPDPDGFYSARQFGILTVANGSPNVVAVAVCAPDVGFATATAC